MSTAEELNERIASFSPEHRNMLADAVDVLSQCFGTGEGQALVVFIPPQSEVAQLFLLNCNEGEAYNMAAFAKAHAEAVITRDMPDKELLN